MFIKSARLRNGVKAKMRELCNADENGIISEENALACKNYILENITNADQKRTALFGLYLWLKASEKAKYKINGKEKAKDDI